MKKPSSHFRNTAIAMAISTLTMTGNASAYTASTIQDLSTFYDSSLTTASGFDTLNGQSIDWSTNADGSKTYYLGAGYLGGKLSWASNDKNGVVQALALALGIPPEEIFINSKGTSGAAQTVSSTVFSDLIVPHPTTIGQQQKAAARKRMGMPRSIAASVRYSYMDTPADNGYLAGLNLGLAWDSDSITTGFIMPYDYTDLDGLLSASRLGLIWFGQYSVELSPGMSGRYTIYADYSDTSIDYDAGGDNHVYTHGGGAGASLTWKTAGLTSTVGATVQEHRDNSGGDRTFDTLKVGLGTAMFIGQTQAIGLNATWTNDFSDYDAAYDDRNLLSVGMTYRNDLSDTWGLNVGITHKFDYNDISITEIYLGSAMAF